MTLENESGDEELLLAMLVRVARSACRKPDQRPHIAPAQSAAPSGTWYDDAIAKAGNFKTDAAGTEVVLHAAAAARDGKCTPGQRDHVQNLINVRIADRRKAIAVAILEVAGRRRPVAGQDP